jgi:hypothetical protein
MTEEYSAGHHCCARPLRVSQMLSWRNLQKFPQTPGVSGETGGFWGVKTGKIQFSVENYKDRGTYSSKKIFMSTEMAIEHFPSSLSTYISAWKYSKTQI